MNSGDKKSLVDLDDCLVDQAIMEANAEGEDEALEEWLIEHQPTDFPEEESRVARGLASYPFDPDNMFVKVDKNGEPFVFTEEEIIREVSRWFVRQEFRFFEVDKPESPLSRYDLIQTLAIRIRSTFTGFELTEQSYKLILDALINSPTASPETTFPIWDGTLICRPGNNERLIFDKGRVSINTWKAPEYRQIEVDEPSMGPFLSLVEYMMPNLMEREVFLDWLSWCLQHEDDKPSWAIFLFSEKHGTGKSTLAGVVKQLFGEENTSEQQGVQPLVNRFNRPILSRKLVYAEEVKVSANSDDGNKLKTLISERSTMSEAKGRDIAPIEHRCCFILTTNHKPIWLEPGDRRFYIIKIDHEGYSAGGTRYDEFVELAAKVKRHYALPENVAVLYAALKARRQSSLFNPYSLNVNALATEVMREINSLSNDVVEELLEEFLHEHRLLFIPVRYSQKIIEYFAYRNPNAAKYTFDSLGWKKAKFAWGGKGAAWAFYDPKSEPKRGYINTPHGPQEIADHINNELAAAMGEIGFGIALERLDREKPRSK